MAWQGVLHQGESGSIPAAGGAQPRGYGGAHLLREQAQAQGTTLHYDGGVHDKVAAFCAEKWKVATKKGMLIGTV
jgi:hypothetical protein